MAMNRLLYISLAVVALLVISGREPLSAQQGNVDIVTAYDPDIESASKLLAPITLIDDRKYEPEIEYNIESSLWQIELDAHLFKPARANFTDDILSTSYEHFFAKAALGYPLGSDLALRYAIQEAKRGYIGVGVDHDGDFQPRLSAAGQKRTIANSFAMHNRVLLNGGVFIGESRQRMLEAAIIYDNDLFNGYAMTSPERLMFHDANVALRFGDDFIDLSHLNFVVDVDGGVWAHRMPASDKAATEGRASASLKMARQFGKNRVDANVDFSLWQGGKQLNYRDIRFCFGGDYSRRFGFVTLEAGVGYTFDKIKMQDKAKHYVLPRAKVMFDLEKASFVPYVEVNSTIGNNGPSSLYGMNPYIDNAAMADKLCNMRNSFSYNLSLGFTGTVLKSRLSYQVYAGANFMQSHLFWYLTAPGMFGVTTANNSRIFVGAGVKALPVTGLEMSFDFYYHFDNNNSKYLLSDPSLRSMVDVRYTLSRWSFYINGDLCGKRAWSIAYTLTDEEGMEQPTEFSKPLTFDLGAGLSYRLGCGVELFVSGENLLNNKFLYDFAHYYKPGAGFMIGAKIDF